jgi:hypothetical protein
MTKRLSPSRAIKKECQWCLNNRFPDCGSRVCILKNDELTPLRKIRKHCLDCAGDSFAEVKACDGKVLYPEPHTCYLHEFRFGKNPRRRGIGDASRFKKG